MITTHDRFIDVPGGSLFVRRWRHAEPSGPAPLVLMHDSLGCVDLWGSFPRALAEGTGREVIAYDRLGYGRSSPRVAPLAEDFIREEAARFFPLVLEALDVGDFGLLGHSLGGGMAVTVAAQWPHRCVAVVSESAQALIEPRTVGGIIAARAHFEDPAHLARLISVHGTKAPDILRLWSDAWLKLNPESWSLTKGLPPLACPILIIHGDHDEFGSLQNVIKLSDYAGALARTKILAGCGHIPHRERRDEVIDAIASFLVAIR